MKFSGEGSIGNYSARSNAGIIGRVQMTLGMALENG